MDKNVTRENDRWILTATILASSMAFIDSTALNVALPAIQANLKATGPQLLWILNGYLLMLAALILVGGSLGDRLGRKKVYMIGITLFGFASLACGLSPSVQFMIGARIIQGIGGALMIPGSLAIITASISPNQRGKAIGTWSAVTTLVTVAGPLLGGILSDLGLWRAVFLINLPVGIAALIILYLKVPESRDEAVTGKIDTTGAALAMVGLAGLTYGFISAPDAGFGSPTVYVPLLVGFVGLVAFGLVEARKKNPMMPLTLFESKTFSGANLLTLFLYGALSVMSFFLSLNLVQIQGYSKTQAGLTFLPFTFLLAGMSRWAGALADRRGPRLFLILGPATAGLGFLWLAFTGITGGPENYWTTFLPGIILFGVGMGFTVAPLSASVMGSVDTHYAGTASGVNNAVSRVAGVLSIAIAGSIALFVFANSLQAMTANLNLPAQVKQSVQAQANNLGGATVPPGVPQTSVSAVQNAIRTSFVHTFQVVMLICAGMAWVAALTAGLLVEPHFRSQSNEATTESG